MNIRDIGKRITFTFFRAWGISWFILLIVGLLSRWQALHFEVFYTVLIISVLASLTYIVLYSKKGLIGKQIIIRFCIQFLLVVGIVVAVPYLMGIFNITYFSITTLVIISIAAYFAVALYEWFAFLRLANKINEKLKEHFK